MSKKVKSINKLVATMIIVVIGAFIVLFNSKNSKEDLFDESIIKSDTTLIDSIIVKEIYKDSIIVKNTIVNDTVFSDTLNTIK